MILKSIIKYSLITVGISLGFLFLFNGLITTLFAFDYFEYKEPRNIFWLNELLRLKPEVIRSIALITGISGIVCSLLPVTVLWTNLHHYVFAEKPLKTNIAIKAIEKDLKEYEKYKKNPGSLENDHWLMTNFRSKTEMESYIEQLTLHLENLKHIKA
jgi:hypothetical protein